MSILYGFVNLDGRPADPAILANMGTALKDKKTDAHSAYIDGNAALGFYNQFITEESHYENQPYYDKEAGLYCICDAIIDNRDELAGLLGLRLTKELSDGQIIFESYKKWGKDCTRYLLGDFAFVVYDAKNRLVQLFRDHLGLRLLYYRRDGGSIYFSTLINPLVNPLGDERKPELDEKYLVYFFAIDGICQEILPGSTIYHGINYVLPASFLSVTDASVSSDVYWDPNDIRPDRRLKKSDYIEEFKDIYYNAVRCRLRADGEVGVMLSGGLDSSSVACVAASILREKNKQLFTYTSVPVEGFNNWAPRQWNADESGLVKTMLAANPNMAARFIDAAGKNSITVTDQVLALNEQPYKSIDNSYWPNEIYHAASKDGCKVLLSGSLGNATVSYGMFRDILFEHFMRLRCISFIRDFNIFCRNNNVSRKKFLNDIKGIFLRAAFSYRAAPLVSSLVKPEYLKIYDVENQLRTSGLTKKPMHRDQDLRRLLLQPVYLHQCYSMDVKYGCSSGVNMRDPTGDKQIVEFCMRLPYDCYFDKTRGQARSLIRRAMSGVVPDEILRHWRRGLQAADWLERLVPEWDDYIRDFSTVLQQPNPLLKYLNLGFIEKLADRNNKLAFSFDTSKDVRNIIIIDNCIKFQKML